MSNVCYNAGMATYTFKADEKTIERIRNSFEKEYFIKQPPYSKYRISYDNCQITAYESGTVVFQGANADIYYHTFAPVKTQILPQAGSDEVGTGDFFGPVCVCACYIDESIYQKISHLNLVDSKRLSDEQIEKIGPILDKEVPHSLLILDNARYNKVIKDNNLNRIKARMHNKCYLNLKDKGITLPELTVIDDFCGKDLYYHYLKGEPKIVNNITFQTKAEDAYIAVACGAIISRYAFLESMKAMSKKYNFQFPKGAGKIVNEKAREFIKLYPQAELAKVAKLNFKTVETLLIEK